MTQQGRPYRSVEDEQARDMQAAAEKVGNIPSMPRPIWAAIGHVLFAAAMELANGRRLPIEVRRAALHMVRAIDEASPRR